MPLLADHGANNFATIRTTSIVTKQQKEHMQVNIRLHTSNSLLAHKSYPNLHILPPGRKIIASHLQEEMHEQMSGYKRMRREHQSALMKLEERCKLEMEGHKIQLDKEYELLLGSFSRDLEKLQVNTPST